MFRVLSVFFLLLCLVFAQHRLEPPNGQILHCAGQTGSNFGGSGGFKGYSDYLMQTTRPVIFMVYLPVNNPLNNMSPWFNVLSQILSSYGSNQWIGVQLGLWFSGLSSQVASGVYDTNIQTIAEQIAMLKRPVWLRIGYEFNGEWNNYTSADYPRAYQRITNIFRSNPVTNRYVATVWDFSADASSDRLNFLQWYPGDDYVDWWGVNIFSNGSAPNSPIVRNFAKAAQVKGFPVLLGESTPRYIGALQGQTSWNEWFRPYFDLIEDPTLSIRGFCYINWNWAGTPWPNWGDAEIEKNDYVGTHYQSEMSKKLSNGEDVFFHASNEATVLSKLGL